MHFTINATSLSKALQTVARVVEKRNTIPVLSNIVVAAEGASITLRATDLDIEVSLQVDATVQVEGEITVAGHLFSDIVRKMNGDVVFKFDGQNAVVSSGRSKFSLQTLPTSDFPTLTVGEFSHTFEMPSAELRRLFKRVAFAISTEETRYYLNGIFLHTMDETGSLKMRAVATDGHRLARMEIDGPSGSGGMPGIIVPRKTVGEVDRMLDLGDVVTVSVSASKIRFDVGSAVLTSKLIDGTFPQYERVIPEVSNSKVFASKADFGKAVDRVSTVSSQRGRAVKMSFDSNSVSLYVSSPDFGEATEDVAIDYDGDAIEIGFNAQYIQDILNSIETDQIEIHIKDSGSPARFHPLDDTSLVLVAMPMRV